MGRIHGVGGRTIRLREWSGQRFRGYTPHSFTIGSDDEWLITHLYCIPPADRTPPYPDEPLFAGDIVLRSAQTGGTCFRAPARSLMDVYYRLVYGVDDPNEVLGVSRMLRELESIKKRDVFDASVNEEVAKVIAAWRGCLTENSGALPMEVMFRDRQTFSIEREPAGAPLEVEIRALCGTDAGTVNVP